MYRGEMFLGPDVEEVLAAANYCRSIRFMTLYVLLCDVADISSVRWLESLRFSHYAFPSSLLGITRSLESCPRKINNELQYAI